jgi:ribosome assembly protein YihI (activator of Der GTPase)
MRYFIVSEKQLEKNHIDPTETLGQAFDFVTFNEINNFIEDMEYAMPKPEQMEEISRDYINSERSLDRILDYLENNELLYSKEEKLFDEEMNRVLNK